MTLRMFPLGSSDEHTAPTSWVPGWSARVLCALALTLSALLANGCGGSDKQVEKPESVEDDDDSFGDRRGKAPDIGEEEDDDDVQIAGLKGRLDPEDIRRGLKPHHDALFACFTGKVGRRHYLGGEVEFQFVVNPDGTVKTAHMLRSDLGNWTMEKCMLDICQGMTFAEPQGRAEADFTVPLSFDARRPVAVWDDSRAQEMITDEQKAELSGCADESGATAPADAQFTIYVGPRGKVLSVGVIAPSGPVAPEWASCAHDKIMAWTLTDPRGRIKMSYHYSP